MLATVVGSAHSGPMLWERDQRLASTASSAFLPRCVPREVMAGQASHLSQGHESDRSGMCPAQHRACLCGHFEESTEA